MQSPVAVILAAGKGTRMRSDRAKVVHELRGRPLVAYPLAAVLAAGVIRIVVVTGHQRSEVEEAVERSVGEAPAELSFAHQAEQHGTGHAVWCALPMVPRGAVPVLVLSGDVPMLRVETLRDLVAACRRSSAGLSFATFRPADRTGYGRVVRDDAGAVVRIAEERDCTPDQLAISECNSGTYCVEADRLHAILPTIGRDNAKREMYLTDLVERLASCGSVETIEIDPVEAAGVNTPEQLAELERHWDEG
jgi:UDP-N-acetylglucosamine diphosphorylase/glucosamine-1-phosphate N-acetyltransferase